MAISVKPGEFKVKTYQVTEVKGIRPPQLEVDVSEAKKISYEIPAPVVAEGTETVGIDEKGNIVYTTKMPGILKQIGDKIKAAYAVITAKPEVTGGLSPETKTEIEAAKASYDAAVAQYIVDCTTRTQVPTTKNVTVAPGQSIDDFLQ
jgi:hypothetical protein